MGFYDVISVENLLAAWREFRKGKRGKRDVAAFELNLEDNLFQLHRELLGGKWKPDPYVSFKINDPKPRMIHKASVRDRVLYQAVYRKLYPVFDSSFIFDSYSSRIGKGAHAAVKRLDVYSRKVTANYRKSGFVLKCDVRRFFDSVDHEILLSIIRLRVYNLKLVVLVQQIVSSFGSNTPPLSSPPRGEEGNNKGLPLGNVTSQLFANIYLNELDQFIKHSLKAKYYIRYCDDFVILHHSRFLGAYLRKIDEYCQEKLKLELHPQKISLRKIHQGTDFLGYVTLPHRRVVRTKTVRRMLKNANMLNLSSYLGICKHAKAFRVEQKLLTTVVSVIPVNTGIQ